MGAWHTAIMEESSIEALREEGMKVTAERALEDALQRRRHQRRLLKTQIDEADEDIQAMEAVKELLFTPLTKEKDHA